MRQFLTEHFMRQAVALARLGMGRTFPNPCVGALVVRGERAVGSGFHAQAGGPHAEIIALKKAGDRARGGSLFCTLEPCVHTGRTGPCVKAIIAAGIKNVFIGMVDPNPLVRGRGIRRLRRAGIAVTTGILEEACRALNEPFVKAMTRGLPQVTLKVAESLDGKTATAGGESKWITGEDVRRFARRARERFDAILVGINTVLKDDPLLTPASGDHRLTKIVVDSRFRIPLQARLLRTRQPVVIATCAGGAAKEKALAESGACVLRLPEKRGRVDLNALLRELHRREIRSVLVEGGSEVVGAFLDERLADRVMVYVSMKMIGGRLALSAVGGCGVRRLSEAIRVKDIIVKRFKNDILIEGALVYGHR